MTSVAPADIASAPENVAKPPREPRFPIVHLVTKAGRELVGTLTLKTLTDDLGQSDAICFHVKQTTP